MISKAQITAMAAGDSWHTKGANLLIFGPPSGGKSHLAAAIGLALIENGWRVLFPRATDLVQKLQFKNAIAKLDKLDFLKLDDLAYVTKDQAETCVLFELISARFERRSILIMHCSPTKLSKFDVKLGRYPVCGQPLTQQTERANCARQYVA